MSELFFFNAFKTLLLSHKSSISLVIQGCFFSTIFTYYCFRSKVYRFSISETILVTLFSSLLICDKTSSSLSLYSFAIYGFRSFSRSYRILLFLSFFLIHSFILILHRTKSWSLFMVAPGYVLVLVLMILDLNLCGVRI